MSMYTWNEVCQAAMIDFEDISGETLEQAGVSLTDYASGTVLGDEIIAELIEEGLLS